MKTAFSIKYDDGLLFHSKASRLKFEISKSVNFDE
jgi:hypothetical protein